MLDMRLRIPELMQRKDSAIRTAYALAKASGMSMTNAHHLVEKQGQVARVDMDTIDALMRAFGLRDTGPLFTNEDPPPPPSGKPAVHKRKRT